MYISHKNPTLLILTFFAMVFNDKDKYVDSIVFFLWKKLHLVEMFIKKDIKEGFYDKNNSGAFTSPLHW